MTIFEVAIDKASVRRAVLKKLSARSKAALKLMLILYKRSRSNIFSIDDLRPYRIFGTWRDILDSFYELESRDLGMVRGSGADVRFEIFMPVIQTKVT